MDKLLENISKYRTALMGVAILGVMVAHCKGDWPVSVFSKAVGLVCYSVFTGGFLFLSGFGLYHSMHNDDHVANFYKKRVKRLMVPWLCVASPYFIYTDLVLSSSLRDFLMHISTMAFWVDGNYSGMWYISVILMLYLIYPLWHKITYIADNRARWSVLVTVGLLLVTEWGVTVFTPNFHERIVLASSISIFFIGSFVSYLNSLKKPQVMANLSSSGG